MLGPLMLESALSDIPIFGDEKSDLESIITARLESQPPVSEMIYNREGKGAPLSEALTTATKAAEKLRALREYAESIQRAKASEKAEAEGNEENKIIDGVSGLSVSESEPPSRRELHEGLLTSLLEARALPRAAQNILDHFMLLRAKEKYLFNTEINREVVDDDDWLRFVWDWIGDAEKPVVDGTMMQHPLDLSYMGVYTIWTNDLGTWVCIRVDSRARANSIRLQSIV